MLGNTSKRRKFSNLTPAPSTFRANLPPGDLLKWLESRTRGFEVGAGPDSKPYPPNTDTLGAEDEGCDPRSVGSSSKTTRRKDMPIIRQSGRQANRVDLSLGSDVAKSHAALVDFEADFFARSTRQSRDALLQTWFRFHGMWFPSCVPVVPLTTEKLVKVSCIFKQGGYKAFRNYLGRVKDYHCELGHAWTEDLRRTSRKCVRSVLRGLAGPTRSEPFHFDSVVAYLKECDEPVCSTGPESPLAMVVIGVYFMLRELELSAIDMTDVVFGTDSITLSLPVSKVDWQAKGCTRTWSCVCHLNYHCPFHILKLYDEKIRSSRCTGPWIATATGEYCTKQGVVDTLRHVVRATGGVVQNQAGNWTMSGHSFRITGARTLAMWGLDPITIQLLGRWGSAAVLSYLSEAPLDSLVERLESTRHPRQIVQPLAQAVRQDPSTLQNEREERKLMLKHLQKVNHELEDLSIIVDGVTLAMTEVERTEKWWVLNDMSKVMHRAAVNLNTTPANWRTVCGWKFTAGPQITTFRDEPPEVASTKICPKCQPRKAAAEDRFAESSSSSDTSSSS